MKMKIKTIGIITTACALPIASHADIQHICTSMTLQELNQFLEGLRTESFEPPEIVGQKDSENATYFSGRNIRDIRGFQWRNVQGSPG